MHSCLDAEGTIKIPSELSAPIQALIKQRWGGDTLAGLNQVVVHSLGITRPDGYPNWALPENGSPLNRQLIHAFIEALKENATVTWSESFEALVGNESEQTDAKERETNTQPPRELKQTDKKKRDPAGTDEMYQAPQQQPVLSVPREVQLNFLI